MEYPKVNGLNHKASRIGLGAWSIGGFMWGRNFLNGLFVVSELSPKAKQYRQKNADKRNGVIPSYRLA